MVNQKRLHSGLNATEILAKNFLLGQKYQFFLSQDLRPAQTPAPDIFSEDLIVGRQHIEYFSFLFNFGDRAFGRRQVDLLV